MPLTGSPSALTGIAEVNLPGISERHQELAFFIGLDLDIVTI